VAGYFVSALKGDWGSKEIIENGETEVDKAAVFRHWYDLARELGYCSGQEIREGEEWINLSGSWERKLRTASLSAFLSISVLRRRTLLLGWEFI
jgi:hypothetical protein